MDIRNTSSQSLEHFAMDSSAGPDTEVGHQPGQSICEQADWIHQQLETFEHLLKTLSPFEQVQGLTQLGDQLKSLVQAFTVMEQHEVLLQEGIEPRQFDHEQDIKGQITRLAMHLNNIQEQVNQMLQDEPTCDESLSPPPQRPSSFVPSEFEEQLTLLQEGCITFLIKYTDIENKDDDRRVTCDVNLDLTKPENNSLHPDAHSTHQTTIFLRDKAKQYLLQRQIFEDLRITLNPVEQVKYVSQLYKALGSLEEGYLSAWNEHKHQLKAGVQLRYFDPERELERLIFQLIMDMEDLREQVDLTHRDEPPCVKPLPPPLHPTSSSISPELVKKVTPLQEGSISLELDSNAARSKSSCLIPEAAFSHLHQRGSKSDTPECLRSQMLKKMVENYLRDKMPQIHQKQTERPEYCLRETTPQSSVNPAQKNCPHRRSSPTHISDTTQALLNPILKKKVENYLSGTMPLIDRKQSERPEYSLKETTPQSSVKPAQKNCPHRRSSPTHISDTRESLHSQILKKMVEHYVRDKIPPIHQEQTERLEYCLRETTPQSSVNPAQKNCPHRRSSPTHISDARESLHSQILKKMVGNYLRDKMPPIRQKQSERPEFCLREMTPQSSVNPAQTNCPHRRSSPTHTRDPITTLLEQIQKEKVECHLNSILPPVDQKQRKTPQHCVGDRPLQKSCPDKRPSPTRIRSDEGLRDISRGRGLDKDMMRRIVTEKPPLPPRHKPQRNIRSRKNRGDMSCRPALFPDGEMKTRYLKPRQ